MVILLRSVVGDIEPSAATTGAVWPLCLSSPLRRFSGPIDLPLLQWRATLQGLVAGLGDLASYCLWRGMGKLAEFGLKSGGVLIRSIVL